MMDDASITTAEKRQALESILQSDSFVRSHQLSALLRYLCEEELAGRGDEITEYTIGVQVLGRGAGFYPVEDSAVRNRVHALRKKLRDHDARRPSGAEISIDIAPGTYRPRFLRLGKPAAQTELQAIPERSDPPQGRRLPRGVLPAAAALALACAVLFALRWTPPRDSVLDEFWGPLLRRDANVLVCIATPAQIWVRAYGSGEMPVGHRPEAPPGLESWFSEYQRLGPDSKLRLLMNHNSPLWGDSVGAVSIASTLSQAGAPFRVLPERVLPLPALRGRNVVLLGAPEYSPAAERLFSRAAFTIGFHAAVREHVIFARGPAKGEPAMFVPKRGPKGEMTTSYGIITVLPSEGTVDGRERTVVISGLSSSGTQAAAEYFCSKEALLALRARISGAKDHLPRAYQVVVEASASQALPLSYRYTAHRVMH